MMDYLLLDAKSSKSASFAKKQAEKPAKCGTKNIWALAGFLLSIVANVCKVQGASECIRCRESSSAGMPP